MRNSALFKNYAIELVKLKNKVLYKNKVLKNSLNQPKIDLPSIKEYNENRLLGYQPSSCNAPFSSLYFGVNGEVYACCKNRSYVLGNVEKQSIKEIWEGSKIVTLRAK
jgi:MoaA/NifB/PqqE/SkfB family radical SAM enzyme